MDGRGDDGNGTNATTCVGHVYACVCVCVCVSGVKMSCRVLTATCSISYAIGRYLNQEAGLIVIGYNGH
jgi:hypothetical protein